jgi:hypothetical protein
LHQFGETDQRWITELGNLGLPSPPSPSDSSICPFLSSDCTAALRETACAAGALFLSGQGMGAFCPAHLRAFILVCMIGQIAALVDGLGEPSTLVWLLAACKTSAYVLYPCLPWRSARWAWRPPSELCRSLAWPTSPDAWHPLVAVVCVYRP